MRSSAVSPTQQATAAQYNNLRDDAFAASWLLAHQQATPVLTLYVESGNATINGTVVQFAGGSSPSITAPTSHPRIDVLCLKSDGTLNIVTGTENASPVAPTVSDFPICEIYNRVGEIKILDTDDSVNGYIYKDSRSFLASGGNEITDSLIAGEAITVTQPVPVLIGPHAQSEAINSVNNVSSSSYSTTSEDNIGGNSMIGVQFTGYGSVCEAMWFLQGGSNPSSGNGTIVYDIYSDNGSDQPGTLLGTSNSMNFTDLAPYFSGAYPGYTLTFPTPVPVNGKYWLFVRVIGVTFGGNVSANFNNGSGGGGSGTRIAQGNPPTSFYINANGQGHCSATMDFTGGLVYRSDPAGTLRQRVDGLALNTAAINGAIAVASEGFVEGFSGMTPGTDYYLQTDGTLGVTVTASKVGRAITSTKLLIRKY